MTLQDNNPVPQINLSRQTYGRLVKDMQNFFAERKYQVMTAYQNTYDIAVNKQSKDIEMNSLNI